MKINYDLHTHTIYSHGKGTIEENAQAAKEKGMEGIAITDHGFSHPAFGMKRKKLAEMKEHCGRAEELTGVKVLLGIESNIRGASGKIDVEPRDYAALDVILAGVHRFIYYDKLSDYFRLLFANQLDSLLKKEASEAQKRYNTRCYVQAIRNNPIDAVTHPGYLCPCYADEVARCASDYGTYFEINTKKVHLSDDEWRKVIDTGVRFVVDSDAHSVDRVGDTALAEDLFSRVDFPFDRIDNVDGKTPSFRFAEWKKRNG